MKIYKYELELGATELCLPMGARLLKVANQYEKLVAWFMLPSVDSAIEFYENHLFLVAVTGVTFSDQSLEWMEYKDSVLFNNGRLVVHIFYRFKGQR